MTEDELIKQWLAENQINKCPTAVVLKTSDPKITRADRSKMRQYRAVTKSNKQRIRESRIKLIRKNYF